ncbi:MAG: hypothetical protein HC942_07570 [Microcoleus sp. SU_5_6]|nr:hypothetical protein [Microcoleus sp. SU_5_6]NJL69578.1 hypothetical protein [Microcoleus sp. SM1_3_4]
MGDLPITNYQLSTVNCQLSTVNCQLSTVNCHEDFWARVSFMLLLLLQC